MTVNLMNTGPGAFNIGEVGTLTAFQSQVTKISVKPKVSQGDAIPVLSGETVPGDREESFTIAGSILQDFGVAGPAVSISEWTFTNRGKTFPFEFIPDNAAAKKITGTLQVEATEIGGDVKKKNQADFEFLIIGDPVIAALAP